MLRPARILAGTMRVVILIPKVRAPFPHIAARVVQAETIWGKFLDRRTSLVPIVAGVVVGEMPLPPVGDGLASGAKLIAPRIDFPREPAALGVFEFRFRRQPL